MRMLRAAAEMEPVLAIAHSRSALPGPMAMADPDRMRTRVLGPPPFPGMRPSSWAKGETREHKPSATLRGLLVSFILAPVRARAQTSSRDKSDDDTCLLAHLARPGAHRRRRRTIH